MWLLVLKYSKYNLNLSISLGNSLARLLVLIAWLSTSIAFAQSVSYPATGIYNGFIGQTNIVECDNNNTESVSGALKMFTGDGSELANQGFSLRPFGSVHLILNNLAEIADTYGVFSISLNGDPVSYTHLTLPTICSV